MATQADKVNTGALATIAAVLAISVLGIAAALTALVRYETQVAGAEKGVTANLRSYRELVAKQRSELTAEPAWRNKDKQRVSIPVERAMELVVADLRKNPNSATEAADTGDAGAAAPASGDAGAAESSAGAKGADAGQGAATPSQKTEKKSYGPASKKVMPITPPGGTTPALNHVP